MTAFIRAAMGLLVSVFMAGGARAQEKVTFATGSGSVAYVTYYIAQEMGYFKQVGLEPEMILTGSGAKALAAAVGGNVNIVMPTAAEVMKARQNGIDLVLFGAVATQLTTSVVFSKPWAEQHKLTKDSTTEEKIAALKGIKLAISGAGSLTDALIRYLAVRGKLDPDRDMTLAGIPNQSNAMMIAMEQGRVDGFVIAPPDTTIAQHKMGALIAFNPAAGNIPELSGYFHIGLAGSEKFAKSETARKVARAFQMVLDAVHDPKTTIEVRDRIRAAYYPQVDADVFEDVWRNVISAAPRTLAMDDDMFTRSLRLDKIVSPELDAASIKGSYTNAAIGR